jgi:hypothetical protein
VVLRTEPSVVVRGRFSQADWDDATVRKAAIAAVEKAREDAVAAERTAKNARDEALKVWRAVKPADGGAAGLEPVEVELKALAPSVSFGVGGKIVTPDGKTIVVSGKDGDVDVEAVLEQVRKALRVDPDRKADVVVEADGKPEIRTFRLGPVVAGSTDGAGFAPIAEHVMRELKAHGIDRDLIKQVADSIRHAMSTYHAHRADSAATTESKRPERVQESIQTLRDEVRSLREDMRELREALRSTNSPR